MPIARCAETIEQSKKTGPLLEIPQMAMIIFPYFHLKETSKKFPFSSIPKNKRICLIIFITFILFVFGTNLPQHPCVDDETNCKCIFWGKWFKRIQH